MKGERFGGGVLWIKNHESVSKLKRPLPKVTDCNYDT